MGMTFLAPGPEEVAFRPCQLLVVNTCLLCPSPQVYIIRVTWSSGTTEAIYRRYSKFFDLQVGTCGVREGRSDSPYTVTLQARHFMI